MPLLCFISLMFLDKKVKRSAVEISQIETTSWQIPSLSCFLLMLLFQMALLSFYARNSSLKVPLPLILRTRWSQAFSKLGTHSFSLRPTGLSQVSKLLHHVVPSTLNYSGASPGISLQSGFQHSNMLVIFPLVWLIFLKKLKKLTQSRL